MRRVFSDQLFAHGEVALQKGSDASTVCQIPARAAEQWMSHAYCGAGPASTLHKEASVSATLFTSKPSQLSHWKRQEAKQAPLGLGAQSVRLHSKGFHGDDPISKVSPRGYRPANPEELPTKKAADLGLASIQGRIAQNRDCFRKTYTQQSGTSNTHLTLRRSTVVHIVQAPPGTRPKLPRPSRGSAPVSAW